MLCQAQIPFPCSTIPEHQVNSQNLNARKQQNHRGLHSEVQECTEVNCFISCHVPLQSACTYSVSVSRRTPVLQQPREPDCCIPRTEVPLLPPHPVQLPRYSCDKVLNLCQMYMRGELVFRSTLVFQTIFSRSIIPVRNTKLLRAWTAAMIQ